MKEVKKEVKKENLYLTIFNLIKEGKRPSEIQSILKITKQNLQYYINHLKDNEFIKKIGYGTWETIKDFKEVKKTSKKVFSLGLKKANLHALNINIPLSEGKIDLKKLGGYEVKINNWIPQYKKIRTLGITLRNNNNKSISVFVWSREIFDYLIIPSLCHSIVHTVCSYFKGKGVILDYFAWRVTTLHLMIRNEDLDRVLNHKRGFKIEVLLGRDTERISEKDITREAKAWVDKTPYSGVKTNDIAYYKNYILMPENISKMANQLVPTISSLNHNMKTHISVLKGIEKAFNKFNDRLSQTSLRKWL